MNKFKNRFNNKRAITLGITIIAFIIILISVFTISRGLLLAEEEQIEIKSVEIKSDGWEAQEPGAWKITKSAEWTGLNKAQITLDLETVPEFQKNVDNYDIIFVLSNSVRMTGDKFIEMKKSLKRYFNEFLENNNRIALIEYQSHSSIVSDFSDDLDLLNECVDNLVLGSQESLYYSNYTAGLQSVQKLLDEDAVQDDRNIVVLFLTDGAPDKDIGQIRTIYNNLKRNYPNIVINGIQYEMGTTINSYLKLATDYQYDAYTDDIYDKFLVATFKDVLEQYDNFKISDVISEYYLSNKDNININFGTFDIDQETQYINWDLGEKFYTGNRAKMTIEVSTKELASKTNGYYPTNAKKGSVNVTLKGVEKNISNNVTPILKNYYTILYNLNYPLACGNNEIIEETHIVYESVVKRGKDLTCSGYVFEGWKFLEDEINPDIMKISDELFIMPERDLEINGEWGTLNIDKSITGEISSVPLLYDLIKEGAVLDNEQSENVKSDNGIDFVKYSSDTNGRGLYIYTDEEGQIYNPDNPIYYYRGKVINNNVLFGGFCWKIVRTTETGGVKLIYNGIPNNSNPDGICSNDGVDTLISKSQFNSAHNDVKYSGYMYDTNVSSTVKTVIDSWYVKNLKSYELQLEDTVWCADRSYGYDYDSNRYLGAMARLLLKEKPSLSCSLLEDSYTLKEKSINYNENLNGNKLLDYPIAMITGDELILAGDALYQYNESTYNYDQYLFNNETYWILSPGGWAYWAGWAVGCWGGQSYSTYDVSQVQGVRPSVSLKHDTKVISGDGTVNSPYIIG